MDLTIGYLYATGMNVYGDRGNILTLVQRCRWRGIDVEVIERGVGEHSPLERYDLLFAGGGQDRDQIAVSKDLQNDTGRALIDAVERGVVVLAICGTYQLLGHSFKTGNGDVLPGIGVFDAFTEAGTRRFIGDVVVDVRLANGVESLVGFENHSGRTFLHSGEPLGTVQVGAGNNGDDGTEGARVKNAFGTYLHGPLLPKNPQLADHLIRLALTRRYGDVELPPLDDRLEHAAHQAMIERIRRRGRVKSGVR